MNKILLKETDKKETNLKLEKFFCSCGNRLHITNIYYTNKEKTKLKINYDCFNCDWDYKYENNESDIQYFKILNLEGVEREELPSQDKEIL